MYIKVVAIGMSRLPQARGLKLAIVLYLYGTCGSRLPQARGLKYQLQPSAD